MNEVNFVMIEKSSKKITILNVTSRCNLRCGFCFGPENTRSDEMSKANFVKSDKFRRTQFVGPELNTSQAKKIILKLKKSGAKILIFTGGEPLLRADIWELIKYAKGLGFYTVLHTNGMLLLKIKNENEKIKISLRECRKTNKNFKIKKLNYLNQINLPLDGYNAKTNDAMRCSGHFNKVMKVLNLLKNTSVRVIISTVATAKNKNAVSKIWRVLPKWIYKWRIFQFNPQGKAAAVRKEFEISDGEFEKIRQEVSRHLLGFRIQFVGVKDKGFWEGYNII